MGQLRAEVTALSPLVETAVARRWLGRAMELREPKPRVVFRDKAGDYLTVAEAAALPKEKKEEVEVE